MVWLALLLDQFWGLYLYKEERTAIYLMFQIPYLDTNPNWSMKFSTYVYCAAKRAMVPQPFRDLSGNYSSYTHMQPIGRGEEQLTKCSIHTDLQLYKMNLPDWTYVGIAD